MWAGTPDKAWYPWLKGKLEKNGFVVEVPEMPDTAHPRINAWVAKLSEVCGRIEPDTVFVGHSVGCQTILRFLEKQPKFTKCAGVIMVAPWMHLTDAAMQDDDEREIGNHWMQAPINWKEIKSKAKRFVSIFSEDDPYVPLSDSDIFEQKLGSKTVIVKGRGHIDVGPTSVELKEALDAVLSLH